MPMTHRRLLLAGAAAVLMHAGPARAADVTASQGTEAEAQVRAWLGSIVGPAFKIGDRPIQMTPAGDHFDVVLPIRAGSGATASDIRLSAAARPIEGGKWALEGIRVSSPLNFTLDMPVPPKDDAPKNQVATQPVKYTIELTGQDGRATIDPSYATPSTWTMSNTSLKSHAVASEFQQDSRIGPYNTVTTVRPAGGDKVDLTSEGTLSEYHIESRHDGLEPIIVDMRTLRVNAAINGMSRSHATALTQGIATLMASGMMPTSASMASGTAPKVPPTLVKSLVAAMQDLASDMNLDEGIDGLTIKYGNYTATIDKAAVGMGGKSEGGLLQAHMDLGAEGLALPGLALGGLEALLPRRIAMRPFVSGLGVAELMRMANAAADGKDAAPSDIDALYRRGVSAGLESMALEVAGAKFAGQGKVVVTGPSNYTGTAQVTAENFDALIEKVSGMPPLAQAMPVMVFLKGIGKTVDGRLVWDVSVKDSKVLINNMDLTALAGGGAPSGPQKAQPARPRPRQ